MRSASLNGIGQRRHRVSLTIIARNEEANLPACLASVADLFDEIILIDTGSIDRTREVARSLGAQVFDVPWIDDFAAARNAALERATGDVIFWLDADDRIDDENRGRLRSLLDGLRDDGTAFVMGCLSESVNGTDSAVLADRIRLFPNRPEVRWEDRVHEQILPSLHRAGIPIRRADVTIRHTGYTDPQMRRLKSERNARLLMAELRDRPGDPIVLFNLARAALDRKDAQAGVNHLTEALNGLSPGNPFARELHVYLATAHQLLGKWDAALEACEAGLAAAPDDGELLFREAVVRYQLGDKVGAGDRWRRILELGRPERPTCVTPEIYGHLTRRNLAMLAEERGAHLEAFGLWSEVLAECPNDPQAISSKVRLTRKFLRSLPARVMDGFMRRAGFRSRSAAVRADDEG